jgi:hypothetical protein
MTIRSIIHYFHQFLLERTSRHCGRNTKLTTLVQLSPKMRKLGNVLSLQHFIHRQRVLGLFREMLRMAMKMKTNNMKEETIKQIRFEFHKNKEIEDKLAIKSFLIEGDRQKKYLSSLIGNSLQDKVIGQGWPWERSK